MIKKEDVIRIGQFAKPHGIKGEIALAFTSDIFDRSDCDYLMCEIEGILVPFFIEEYRFKNDSTALIKFEDVDTEADAKGFANREVYFPKVFFDEGELEEEYNWDYFTGFKVIDAQHGDLGEITYVDESTINVLLQVEKDRNEILIPAVEEFITDIDHENKVLRVALPEGLVTMDRDAEFF